jgi:hypothetical protein
MSSCIEQLSAQLLIYASTLCFWSFSESWSLTSLPLKLSSMSDKIRLRKKFKYSSQRAFISVISAKSTSRSRGSILSVEFEELIELIRFDDGLFMICWTKRNNDSVLRILRNSALILVNSIIIFQERIK